MVGILIALSAVALVQYGKYKRNAGAEVASAQSQFESENCIGVPNRKQCLCDRGLGEVLGLDSEDCCPLGQEKDSNGNCVARGAQASSYPQNPNSQTPQRCLQGQGRNSDGVCVAVCKAYENIGDPNQPNCLCPSPRRVDNGRCHCDYTTQVHVQGGVGNFCQAPNDILCQLGSEYSGNWIEEENSYDIGGMGLCSKACSPTKKYTSHYGLSGSESFGCACYPPRSWTKRRITLPNGSRVWEHTCSCREGQIIYTDSGGNAICVDSNYPTETICSDGETFQLTTTSTGKTGTCVADSS